jgi:C1A family cysteine protease
MSKHHYGWIKSKNHNVKKYSVFNTKLNKLPSLVDLRPKDCPIYDQSTLGSCTANGVGDLIEFIQKDLIPSRLFIYYNERVIEGTINQDAGGQIHDAVQAVVQKGICSESLWPYDIEKFAEQPPQNCYDVASKDIITDYFELETLDDIKQCLSVGFPVVFGITLYDSFESDKVEQTGIVPNPKVWEQIVGGHCMAIVGYDDKNKWFIVRNSWGPTWGANGYCYISYKMFAKYASDFWTIRKDSAQG